MVTTRTATFVVAYADVGVTMVRRPPNGLSLEDSLRFHGWVVTGSGCWEWQGNISVQGYGRIRGNNTLMYAHRAAYIVWVGPVSRDLEVRHKCDNPPCMNPSHLEPGTHGDNMRDMFERKRATILRGERRSNLSELDVRMIRSLYATGLYTQGVLSDFYGIDSSNVSRIINKRTWDHIDKLDTL